MEEISTSSFVEKRDEIFKSIPLKKRSIDCETVSQVLELCIEIAREGREGKRVGTLFVIGDDRRVLKESRTLIMDPLKGHPKKDKHITNPNLRETVKELAQLDGGFMVSGDGYVLSSNRHFNADIDGVEVHYGLGSRHVAAASITKRTDAIAIVVSMSSIVRIFDRGRLIIEILPELRLMDRISSHIKMPCVTKHRDENIAIVSETKE